VEAAARAIESLGEDPGASEILGPVINRKAEDVRETCL
jgi:hypothetical protein